MNTFYLKFQGFYGSMHSREIEAHIENEKEYYLNEHEKSESIKEFLYENNLDFWEVVDYKETYKNYSRIFLDAFTEDLNSEYNMNLSLEFIGLDSPKYYNYGTDKIEFKTDFSEAKVREFLFNNEDVQERLENEIDDITTPRDGYIPFYTFKQIMFENKDNTLISCFFDSLVHGFEQDKYFYEDIHENISEATILDKQFKKVLINQPKK